MSPSLLQAVDAYGAICGTCCQRHLVGVVDKRIDRPYAVPHEALVAQRIQALA